MSKTKELTLRQQMRVEAAHKLMHVARLAEVGVARAIEEAGVDLQPVDVMRICVGGQTKTLQDRLTGLLANQAEKELVELWNNQQKLDLGENDGD